MAGTCRILINLPAMNKLPHYPFRNSPLVEEMLIVLYLPWVNFTVGFKFRMVVHLFIITALCQTHRPPRPLMPSCLFTILTGFIVPEPRVHMILHTSTIGLNIITHILHKPCHSFLKFLLFEIKPDLRSPLSKVRQLDFFGSADLFTDPHRTLKLVIKIMPLRLFIKQQ